MELPSARDQKTMAGLFTGMKEITKVILRKEQRAARMIGQQSTLDDADRLFWNSVSAEGKKRIAADLITFHMEELIKRVDDLPAPEPGVDY